MTLGKAQNWPYREYYHLQLSNELFTPIYVYSMLGSWKLLHKYLGMERKRKGRRKDKIFRHISKNANQPICLMGLNR